MITKLHFLSPLSRNYSLFREHSDSAPRSFHAFVMERSSQSAAQAMDQNGVLFFGLLSDLAIGCWNSVTHPEYGGTNTEVVVVEPDTLQFPSGLKVNDRKHVCLTKNCAFSLPLPGPSVAAM